MEYLYIVQFLNGCSDSSTDTGNLSDLDNGNTSEELSFDPIGHFIDIMNFSINIIFIVLSVINIIVHLFSYLVFMKWKKSPMMVLLKFLSVSEIFFNFAFFIVTLISISPAHFKTTITSLSPNLYISIMILIFPLTKCTANACIIMRNWNLVLIAFARYEVVKYPIKPKKFFEGTSLNFILIIISTVSWLYGLLRIFEYKLVFCLDNNYQFQVEELLMASQFYTFIMLNVGFHILQGSCPAVCVFILSISLIYQLRLAARVIKRQRADIMMNRIDSPIAQRSRSNTVNKPKDEFKNLTVHFLSITFFILEIPQCAVYSLHSIGIIDDKIIHPIRNWTTLLLLADSLCNFWIYAASNRKFRTALHHIICCSNGPITYSRHSDRSNVRKKFGPTIS